MGSATMEYGVPYRIYKPGKNGDGSASKLETRREASKYGYDINTFWCVAKQDGVDKNGNAKFRWKDQKVNVKLSVTDISKFLLVLRGKSSEAKLFHVPGGAKTPTTEGDNTSLVLAKSDRGGYSVTAVSKRGGVMVRAGHLISEDEAVVLENWFTTVLTQSWDRPPQGVAGGFQEEDEGFRQQDVD